MVDSLPGYEVRGLFRELIEAVRPGRIPERYLGTTFRAPRQRSLTMDQVAAAGTAASAIVNASDVAIGGRRLTLSVNSHAGALVEVFFDFGAASSDRSALSSGDADGWYAMRPGDSVSLPPDTPFRSFKVRRQATALNSATIRAVFTIDGDGREANSIGAFAQVTPGGSFNTLMRALQLDGDECDVEGADGSAATRVVPAIAAWTGAAYVRLAGSAAGRLLVNLITGEDGITAGAGAVAAGTPRVTLASNDPAVVALQIIDDWDESDRAKVNPIVGQAGVSGGVGDAGAATLRNVPVTVPTAVASQATAAAASAQIVAANANRSSVTVKNRDSANSAVINAGAAAVVATHFLLPAGAAVTIYSRQAIHAIRVGAADVTLDVWEESYA